MGTTRLTEATVLAVCDSFLNATAAHFVKPDWHDLDCMSYVCKTCMSNELEANCYRVLPTIIQLTPKRAVQVYYMPGIYIVS